VNMYCRLADEMADAFSELSGAFLRFHRLLRVDLRCPAGDNRYGVAAFWGFSAAPRAGKG